MSVTLGVQLPEALSVELGVAVAEGKGDDVAVVEGEGDDVAVIEGEGDDVAVVGGEGEGVSRPVLELLSV